MLVFFGICLYRYLNAHNWNYKAHVLIGQSSDSKRTSIFHLSNFFSSVNGVTVEGDTNATRTVIELYMEDSNNNLTVRPAVIAIGGGMTSRSITNVSSSNAASKFQFFHTFMPTFCSTASPSYAYRFYLAFDKNDPVFTSSDLAAGFEKTFAAETMQLCERPRGIKTSLHLVQCDHSRRPAWAQNDAMLEAYLDHVDYFFRINDDTK
jgi:hypothetical protein